MADHEIAWNDPALRARAREDARDLVSFLDRSPTPYHAVREVARRLETKGFRELREDEAWSIQEGQRAYVIRGGSTILAFVAGTEAPETGGFTIVGAHTDSPNLRVKPNAETSNKGYQEVGVEVYGGVLLSTWLDRDLSCAGRVVVDESGSPRARLVDLERPVGRVANLAIHLNRGVNKDGLVLNEQKHLAPIVGLGKEPALKRAIASELDVSDAKILGFDLMFYDTLGATLGGLEGELVFGARLDNLASCHASISALVETVDTPTASTRAVVLYDHEEVGSKSAIGAAGSVLRDVLGRIVDTFRGARSADAFRRAMARSFLVSADMAHAVHPNYDDRHEPQHQPMLNRGLVIKTNVNQSYATDGFTASRFELLCRAAGYAPQRFVVRSDLPCGSTIGPISAAQLGVATVDVGAPMLSMHSCREMAGTLDVHLAIETFKRLFASRS